MVNDTVSDMISRIKNGYLAKSECVEMPTSNLKARIAKILAENGFLSKVEVDKRLLILTLKYDGRQPAVTQIKRVSKPSLRVYAACDKLPKVLGGMGIAIISTPKGVMTNKQAHKDGVGGEVLCEVY